MTSRREFLTRGATAVAFAATPFRGFAQKNSPFKVSVITDEISDDFDRACSIAANDFGLGWVEIRGLWGTNIAEVKSDEISRAQAVLAKYNLRVTDIASPLFKVDWPGAARLQPSAKPADPARAEAALRKQADVLAACIAVAKQFKTDKIRCFDFWRLADQTPYRAAMDDKLREACDTANKQGIDLVIENEPACNTAMADEAARVLSAVPKLNLNWDPGNAALDGEVDVFPVGFNMLPKDRIHHCHVKNVVSNAAGKREWAPVDKGYIDWAAQFRALKAAGYRQAVSLETHWRGAGTPEASSRISWAGMKKELQDSQTL
ncbi:MAG TPA: sugar phosphate isomerase/epimerase family protein [Acidobacteriaceae bacterium]|jgi:sugar phosphate isomerase/epimerase|nr:sugar phosphate isomerase/epimerase family protein [Acidobacteriaceae bacterium]